MSASPGRHRFICWHTGPRGRQYGIPAVLHQAGMLERFHTDLCIRARTGALIAAAWPAPWRPRFVRDLLSRTLPAGLPRGRVRTLPVGALRPRGGKRTRNLNNLLRAQVARDGFRGASAVYSIINQDLELLQEAKAAGLKIVHDHILSPDVGLILREERARFPGIERQDSEEWVWRGIERDRAQWALADLVLAPAEHSQQAIRELGGDAARIERVPYGVSDRWLETQPRPEPGRVLFVGSVGLRKGTHYLAAAARRLEARGVSCEVVVAGPFDPQAIERPEFHGPTYLGSIPRSEVQKAFLRADLFVHPSLAEGCPIASLEALACGLPVIATPNAGTVINDGEAGFLVPIRDAEALADRIERLVTDRALRQQMSNAAREQARTVTWSAYRERLIQAIESHLGEIDDDVL